LPFLVALRILGNWESPKSYFPKASSAWLEDQVYVAAQQTRIPMPTAGARMLVRNKVIVFSCLLSVASLALGANSPEDAAVQTIRPEGIRAHVEFLADDLLEGRGTGTRGHELAAKYVAAQFEAMGLKPAGVNGTYFQPIPFRSALIVPEQT